VAACGPPVADLGPHLRHRPPGPQDLDIDLERDPWATWAAKVVCRVRGRCSSWASSASMARTAMAVMMPPWGRGRRFQRSSSSADVAAVARPIAR
jgi:hypothetical protein